MNIAIIGTGNVGCTLALAFQKARHQVIFGVRNTGYEFKGKPFAIDNKIQWLKITDAVAKCDVIILCAPAHVAHEVARTLGDVSNKIIIDTMNTASAKPAHYTNTADAVLDNCNCTDVVKCFNTTGFENMANPYYNDVPIDMFIAGSSIKAKDTAKQLSKDIGFGEVYDFGGNDKFSLIEQLAMCWINRAIIQKNGRGIAFKILKRN